MTADFELSFSGLVHPHPCITNIITHCCPFPLFFVNRWQDDPMIATNAAQIFAMGGSASGPSKPLYVADPPSTKKKRLSTKGRIGHGG
jgi:hypothetical protein